MNLLIIGFTVFFNIAIILQKISSKRYFDASLDMALLAGIIYIFQGSFDALVVGTIASFLVSLYLFFFSNKLINDIKNKIKEIGDF